MPGAELHAAVHVLSRYKQQQTVERRTDRSILKVRPVFLHNDDRIDALRLFARLADPRGATPHSEETLWPSRRIVQIRIEGLGADAPRRRFIPPNSVHGTQWYT